MGTPCHDAAKTYATHCAPYLQYLNSIQQDWKEAEVLSKHLNLAATRIPTVSDECVLQGERTIIAQILDISVATDDQGNATYKVIPTSTLGRHLVRPPSGEVEQFLQQIRSCEPKIGTRILVLHRQWGCTDQDKAADTLLFCHILGMELDLRPSDVSILAHIVGLDNGHQPHPRHPLRAGYVSLGSLDENHCNSAAASLGIRDFQGGSANLGAALNTTMDFVSANSL
jgi:hypothetical protein